MIFDILEAFMYIYEKENNKYEITNIYYGVAIHEYRIKLVEGKWFPKYKLAEICEKGIGSSVKLFDFDDIKYALVTIFTK